jgi:hypothetical protein
MTIEPERLVPTRIIGLMRGRLEYGYWENLQGQGNRDINAAALLVQLRGIEAYPDWQGKRRVERDAGVFLADGPKQGGRVPDGAGGRGRGGFAARGEAQDGWRGEISSGEERGSGRKRGILCGKGRRGRRG